MLIHLFFVDHCVFSLDPPYETPPRSNEGLPATQTEQVTAPAGLGLPEERADQVSEDKAHNGVGGPGGEDEEESEEEEDESEDVSLVQFAPKSS